MSSAPLSNNTGSTWDKYFVTTDKFNTPRPTTEKVVKFFEEEGSKPQLAIDLGCGVGNDTDYLFRKGWTVIALDKEASAFDYVRKRVGSSDKVTFVVSKIEHFLFPINTYQLVNASYALPFCPPKEFQELMTRICDAIQPGGRFAGHFFGPNDSWSSDKDMVFLTKSEVEKLFPNFDIEYYEEEDKDGTTATSGGKHWHLHHIIAKKKDLNTEET